jgi:flagellar biosynthetic protein FlhB
MAEQDFDQTEEATDHKLQEARKKGSVAKSMDLNSMAILAVLAVVVYATGWASVKQALRIQQRLLGGAGQGDWSVEAVAEWLGQFLVAALTLLGPLLLAVVVVALAINLVQTGPVFSMEAVKLDLERLNPAAGFKRIFSMRTLFEGGKSIIKMAVLGGLLVILIKDAAPGLLGLPGMDPKGYLQILLALASALLVKLVLALLVIALVDTVFTRWEFAKRMRMSKREVKDETKNREGDPRIRSRIRELRREMLKRSQSAGQVKSADVLITNPTHIAVALSYTHGKSGAPQVVAKGAGGLASRMRKIASRHGIPIVQNKPLARTLFREVAYDGYVPEKLYPQIAKIMVWVYAMRQSRRQQER